MSEVNQTPGEAEWEYLTNERLLSARRKAAEKKYESLGSEQISYLRRRAKADLFFLCSGLLEYNRLSPVFHGHFCSWLARQRNERYRMFLWPRDHYKSTVITISESVQMALPNDAGVQEWPYLLGPNIKILLGHEARESATRFLYEVTRAFMEKPLMLALFPELIPSKRLQRINKWELDLPRTEHHKEPTFDTIGVGGAAQGRHYNWLNLDDLVGEDARDSELVMKRVLLWFDNINALLTRLKLDGWNLTGTRWSGTDVYSHAVKSYGVKKSQSVLNAYLPDDIEKMKDGQLVIYARGAIEAGEPVFPEEFAIEDLNRIRNSPNGHIVWAAQYANNPRIGGLTEFQPHWLKSYNVRGDGRLVVFAGDSSWTVDTKDLDRLIMIDPAMSRTNKSDETGFVVTGTDPKMNVYILEAWKKRLRPPEVMDEMFRLFTKWNPRLVSIESVAFSEVFAHWFSERCQNLGIYPSIHLHKRPGGRGAKNKHSYIRALGNYGAGGQLYCLDGMHQLKDEWEWFPMGNSEHILDALAQGPEIWSAGRAEGYSRDIKKAVDLVLDERDSLTGY